MSSLSGKLPWGLPTFAGALLILGLLGTTATAEDGTQRASPAPSSDPTAEEDGLQRLAADFKRQRADLDARRHALQRDLDVLSAAGRAATNAEFNVLRQRIAAADSLAQDIEHLRALVRELTPLALEELARRELRTNLGLKASSRLLRTEIAVNLRSVPDGPPVEVLGAESLVVRLATDDRSGWSLVATPRGFGFVPGSQLRPEP